MRTILAAALAVAALGVVPAGAQTVGEILDAGGRPVSPASFRQDVVQRPLVATLEPSISAEIVYTSGGAIEGAGSAGRSRFGAEWSVEVRGNWTVDRDDRICSRIVLDGPTIRANFPPRCQYWFRRGDRYYVAGSKDRDARVLARTLKE